MLRIMQIPLYMAFIWIHIFISSVFSVFRRFSFEFTSHMGMHIIMEESPAARTRRNSMNGEVPHGEKKTAHHPSFMRHDPDVVRLRLRPSGGSERQYDHGRLGQHGGRPDRRSDHGAERGRSCDLLRRDRRPHLCHSLIS